MVSQAVITDGDWHRVGLVWDSTNIVLYVGDVEVASYTQPLFGSSGDEMYIGVDSNRNPGSFWSGLIDDVSIYDRAIKY